jgi:predicted RecB family nuclease
MGYSIKDLAPVAGFKWKAQDAGGAMSLLKYKAATANEVDEKEKQEAIKWLYEYNLDDIRATFAVRGYLRTIREGWK